MMEELSCQVVRDLLPLYHDGVCSKDSRALVEEHLKTCPACRAELEKFDKENSRMKGDVLILAPNDGTSRSIADVFAADKDVSSYVITGQDAEIASVQYVIDGKQSMATARAKGICFPCTPF